MLYSNSNVLVVGYVKDLNIERKDFKLFADNLDRSVPHRPIHLLTHDSFYAHEAPWLKKIVLPDIGHFSRDRIGDSLPSDRYALWGFVEAIRLAKETNSPYFLYVEDDCRFSALGWDSTMIHELVSFRPHALLAGSPVFWHPWMGGHLMSRKAIDFAYEYQCRSQVPMAFEGAHIGNNGQAFYPNGALAIYNTDLCCSFFKEPLEMGVNTVTSVREELALRYHAFDLYVGQQFLRHYQDRAFEYLFGLSKSYSGCKDHHVTANQRIQFLTKRRKVAVHHLKAHESPTLSWL